ncbi:Acetyl-coenzyme A synthetase [anaerobic digester metagenome]
MLESHAAVEQAAVVGAAHELLGEEVVAVLRLAAGARLDAVRPELDALCRRELQAIAVPARYMAVQDFPRSSTGKIQKNLLRVMAAPQKDAAS